jgi:hypothetical protein
VAVVPCAELELPEVVVVVVVVLVVLLLSCPGALPQFPGDAVLV